MKTYSDNHLTIREYLLGTLTLKNQRRVEETLLTSQQYFNELLAGEDDLIDDYLGGGLTGAERTRFENYFLATPERIAKLKFARLLRSYLDEGESVEAAPVASTDSRADSHADSHADSRADSRADAPSFRQSVSAFLKTVHPAVRFSLAAVLLLILCGGALIGIMRWQQSNGTTDRLARTAPPEASPAASPGANRNAPARPASETPRPPIFAATLSPGLVRSSGATKRIVVPRGANTVQLRLELMADDYPRYRALLKTDEREIFAVEQLQAEAAKGERHVALNLPAQLLTPADYQVVLSGETGDGRLEDIGKYVFRVPAP
jgi:hypothetical protein